MNSLDNSSFRGLGDKIFLVGFMGSGKTHWGRIWAKHSALDFFDLDEAIAVQEKKSIEAIFDEDGEALFREKESRLLRTFGEKENCIIACGGGTACFHDNMSWMNAHGTTVYLKTTASQIMERVETEKHTRPLIKKLNKAEILFFIEQKLKEREPYYQQARIILSVGELNADSLKGIANS